jgi:hypothetical protein
MSNQHPTITLRHPSGEYSADIDEEIASLIAAMWSNGWLTRNSCQNNHGFVWVEMEISAAEALLTAVARNASKDVSWGAREAHTSWRGDRSSRDPDQWDLATCAHNLSETLDEEADEIVEIGPPEITLTISVRFPPEHLKEVIRAIILNKVPPHKCPKTHNRRSGRWSN